MHLGKNNMEFNNVMGNKKAAFDYGGGFGSTNYQQSEASEAVSASLLHGLITRTITNKDPKVLLQLYKTLVCPHLEYCISAWSPYYEKDKALLERVQHRFTRMIPGFRGLSYEMRLDRWTLEERRNRADLLEVFKMYKGMSLLPFHQFFCKSTVVTTIGAGRILKVEGHSGGSKYFGAKRRKIFLVPPTFQLCPPSF